MLSKWTLCGAHPSHTYAPAHLGSCDCIIKLICSYYFSFLMLSFFSKEVLMVSTEKRHQIQRYLTLLINKTQTMSLFLQSDVSLMLMIMFHNQSLSTFPDLHSYSQLLLLKLLLLVLHQFLIMEYFCHQWSSVLSVLDIFYLKTSSCSLRVFKWLDHMFFA